jgi:hypothetical protein
MMKLDELLPQLPAIATKGPKGVGKTETGQHAYRSPDGIAVIPASLLGP